MAPRVLSTTLDQHEGRPEEGILPLNLMPEDPIDEPTRGVPTPPRLFATDDEN